MVAMGLVGAGALVAGQLGAVAASTPNGVSTQLAAHASLGVGGLPMPPAPMPPMSPARAAAQLRSLQQRQVASTVPSNGDTNPYDMAVVPFSKGKLVAGDVLVVNFNNAGGTPGAGTTVVEIDPSTGETSTFYQGTKTIVGPIGIAINPTNDIVWLGDYGPANAAGIYDGASANVAVITPTGSLAATYDNQTTGFAAFEGVWGMAESEHDGRVSFYWTNAGDGTTGTGGGVVWRIDPLSGVAGQPLQSSYQLVGGGLGYVNAQGTTAATAGGPQGMAYDARNGTLYVTDDATNQILAISHAAGGGPFTTHVVASGGMLETPQNIAINPTNGDLLVVNGAVNNDLLEYTPAGKLVAWRDLLPNEQAGALFGLSATINSAHQLVIYFGDDDTNTLWSLTGPAGPSTPPAPPTPPVPPIMPVGLRP
jgi:hypothetical protein